MSYPVLSPFEEIAAYEALWDSPNASFRTIAKQLSDFPKRMPSSFVETKLLSEYKKKLFPVLKSIPQFGIRIYGDGLFPDCLKDANHPVKALYFQGIWELICLPCIAIVGTRKPSQVGIERTRFLVKNLVKDKFAIISGLASGIDTIAHQTAIEEKGITIGIIGTPLNRYYPQENRNLQNLIAKDFLLISQVPFKRYERQDYRQNRFFFPERNITMSALSQATIIVEAGETSGTLIQAKAALSQGRKLIILENNFQNPLLTWPKKFEKLGAFRAKNYAQIKNFLTSSSKEG